LTEEKSSGVQIQKKQEEQKLEAQIQKDWFALEAKSFNPPAPLTYFKRLNWEYSYISQFLQSLPYMQ